MQTMCVPSQVSHYRIIEKIGEGGMGVVYRARDEHLGRDVAVKVLPAGFLVDQEARTQLRREARALARLSHPNIAAVYDFDTDEGTDFIVMEFVPGTTLDQRVAGGTLSQQEVLSFGTQIADALAAAHAKQVIHRDLKPQNLRIAADGPIKVLDFGLAKLIRPETFDGSTESFSESHRYAGTLPYMSPEQVRGQTVDARSDIWGLGATMYEMATGRHPFGGIGMDVVSQILHDAPTRPSQGAKKLDRDLESTILKCLEKKPENRFQSADELARHLRKLAMPRPFAFARHPWFIAAMALLLVCLTVAAGAAIRHATRVRWARNTVLPQIEALAQNDRHADALKLAESVEGYLSSDASFRKLLDDCGIWTDIHTNPEGAEAYLRPYGATPGAWTRIGITPLKYRLPRGSLGRNEFVELKFEKAGYAPFHGFNVFSGWYFHNQKQLGFKLVSASDTPAGMVLIPIPGVEVGLDIPGYGFTLPPVTLDPYWLDAYEVTNRDFKKFVDAGGYSRAEFWREPFVEGARSLRFDEAMRLFRDKTGRPGPSTWEAGTYLEETADLPVTGVSWFEANAFAQFSGKSLPTMFHWYAPAATSSMDVVVPQSNFNNRVLLKGGSGLGAFGTFDMAGNAKEWCWNASGNKRFIVGGAYNEPPYMFVEPDAQSPFRRDATYGFRLAKYMKLPPEEAFREINQPFRDYNKEQPVSDAVFDSFRALYRSDKGPLNAKVESIDDSSEIARRERITLDSGYGGERMIVYLFTPKTGHSPFQTVMYYPGGYVFSTRTPQEIELRTSRLDFLLKSGRAVVWPIYKGMNERHDALSYVYQDTSVLWRDHVLMWSKEFARAIDYVESRMDLDRDRIGFFGLSSGTVMGPVLTAMEPRVKANVFLAGGFQLTKTLPECDPLNFAPRVKQPTLMVNGSMDQFFPQETTQKPMFARLGSSPKDKRYAVFASGHTPPNEYVIREVLDWYDKYLGQVN